VDISEIELLEEIGQGAFGKVWKGKMDRITPDKELFQATKKSKQRRTHGKNRDSVTVAVKMLHG